MQDVINTKKTIINDKHLNTIITLSQDTPQSKPTQDVTNTPEPETKQDNKLLNDETKNNQINKCLFENCERRNFKSKHKLKSHYNAEHALFINSKIKYLQEQGFKICNKCNLLLIDHKSNYDHICLEDDIIQTNQPNLFNKISITNEESTDRQHKPARAPSPGHNNDEYATGDMD
eukprot:gb/GEZN01016677.1/.p1 GENE.gb/GEZN01016677.1/~~gb/GEZN01016677.1/.p1  ORF type:complete len:175 (-),score=25.18 gb/GEZN01016677.1/:172-696(-)